MPSSSQSKIPSIACQQFNHHKHPFEYICLSKTCIQHKQNPLCFYCLKNSHQSHSAQTLSLKEFFSQCLQIASTKTNQFKSMTNEQHQQFYELEDLLLNGLGKCKDKAEFCGTLQQIYKATYVAAQFADSTQKRLQKVLNHELKHLRKDTNQFYQQSNPEQYRMESDSTHRSLTTSTGFNIPILTFSKSLPSSENFTFVSPFQVTHNKAKMISTITWSPSLSTFCESLEVFIKVNRVTPNWMGIGISLAQNKYEECSKSHITLLSNGWLNERGQMTKNDKMKYEPGHVIRIQWNKDKKLLIFRNLNSKHQSTLKFQPEWNQDVYLCSVMFFKNDSISILQSGQL